MIVTPRLLPLPTTNIPLAEYSLHFALLRAFRESFRREAERKITKV